jgi:hypothetical protein
MVKIYTLKEEAKIEAYEFIDRNLKKLPRNEDGSFNEFADGFADDDVDALRDYFKILNKVFKQNLVLKIFES